jgi:hypothetical protein
MPIDTTVGTGSRSRWNTILGGGAVSYPARPKRERGVMTWESEPLSADLTITGHPVAAFGPLLRDTSTAKTFFVYLEEVDSTGSGHLVTEGQLDLRHTKVSPAPAWYPRPEAYHSYRRADMLELQRDVNAFVELLPVSHRFARGNRIRLVITRVDKDHFGVPPAERSAPLLGGARLTLPVER